MTTPSYKTPATTKGPLPAFVVIVLANAVIQTLLILPAPIFGIDSSLFLLLAAASTVVLLFAAALTVGTILAAEADSPSLLNGYLQIRPHLWRFIGWTALWLGAIVLGLLFWVVPGFAIAAVFVFVPIAAADGSRNPIVENFRAIRARPGRYLAAVLASAVALFFLYLVGAALAFLLPPSAAAFITWCCFGLVGAWLIRGWVLLYRTNRVIAAA